MEEIAVEYRILEDGHFVLVVQTQYSVLTVRIGYTRPVPVYRAACSEQESLIELRQEYKRDGINFKGTLRRRLSHGYFSFIAKYTSS